MKIDMNIPLCGLDGKQIDDKTIGQAVASLLVSEGKSKDPLKLLEWAEKLYKGEVIDLDTSDQETFKELIRGNELMSDLTKGRALMILVKGGK